MPKNSHRYEPVGVCIYCGVKNTKLSDEHIIAEGLGGTYLLPEASCNSCAKITSAIEGVCVRGPFGNIRLGAGTKRKKPKKPRELRDYKITVQHPNSEDQEIDLTKLSENELPVYFAYPFPFGEPAILSGLEPDEQIAIRFRHFHKDTASRRLALGYKGYIDFRLDERKFLAMLGKIALGFAIAELGYSSVIPSILDLSLGREANPLYFVGRPTNEEKEERSDALHEYQIQILGGHLIVVDLRLFGCYDLPTYRIVVGTLTTPQ